MTFKEGDLVRYSRTQTRGKWAGVPLRIRADADNSGAVLAEFFRSIPELAVEINQVYWVTAVYLEPCSQQDLDNWILERELTK